MSAVERTVARTLAYLGAVFAVFMGVLIALPAPDPATSAGTAEHTPPAFTFAIVGVKVFDGEAFLPERDVWVEDGRFRLIGPELDLPADLARVDGNGRTLVPGFVDAHVHTFGGTLNDAVRFGVTTVLDQFTDPRLAASKRAARDTLAPGNEADLFSAGMLATAAGGHGTQYGTPVEPVGGPDDAAAWVRARKAEGSDWIKIIHEDGSTFGQDIATLDRDTIGALVACRCCRRNPPSGSMDSETATYLAADLRGTCEKEGGARFARIRGMLAATRDSRLLTSSNGCR